MNKEKLINLYSTCPDKYGAAEKMGTTYQTLYNIIYKDSDFKVSLLEKIAKYFKVPVGFFFDEENKTLTEDDYSQAEEIMQLREENAKLKDKVACLSDPNHSEKENRVYNLWMKFMEVTAEMQELYKEKGE